MSVNLDGTFNIVRAALPMIRNDSSIILLSSRAKHCEVSINPTHYGASKRAVVSLARRLARELGPGICVNAVPPGIIETPMKAGGIGAVPK